MGSVSNAIAAAAREAGVEIRVNAAVSKVLVRNGRASGVALESGEEIGAKMVASNLDPKLTFLKLVDEGDLPAEFVDAIRHFRIEGTSCKINLALNGLPEFTAYPGAPGPHHRATMHICPDIEYVERAWDDAKYGLPSERPLLEMDNSHDVRPVAGAARQAHHGHFSAICAVYAAPGNRSPVRCRRCEGR